MLVHTHQMLLNQKILIREKKKKKQETDNKIRIKKIILASHTLPTVRQSFRLYSALLEP
jgi:hypothetical protein